MKKNNSLPVTAVIVAAGKGRRMNMDMNKQYIDLCGKPVLARTIQAFQDCAEVDEIVLVVNAQDILFAKGSIVDVYGFSKVKSIVAGGKERQDSVFNGLLSVGKQCRIVLIHDGARPFVTEKIILDNVSSAERFGAACTATPLKDTIKVSDAAGLVLDTPDRNRLWAVQTPQTFQFGLILQAHRKAAEDGFLGTDDAILAERLGIQPKLVMGGYDNIKITTREDLAIAEAIIRAC